MFYLLLGQQEGKQKPDIKLWIWITEPHDHKCLLKFYRILQFIKCFQWIFLFSALYIGEVGITLFFFDLKHGSLMY